MDKLLKTLGVLVLCILLTFYRLFVIVKVWGYIAVKTLELPPIGMWKAFAISMLITLFISNDKSEKRSMDEIANALFANAFSTSFLWFINYLIFG